jgi:hypothetical protein
MDGVHEPPGHPAAAPEEMTIHMASKLLTQKESHCVDTAFRDG